MGNCISQMKIDGGYTWSALLEDISEDKFKNIIILTGAGISTSAGIPGKWVNELHNEIVHQDLVVWIVLPVEIRKKN